MANDHVEPKVPFYRSKAHGDIYPAMTSPSGHEDNNPDDWEPCTPTEIAHERSLLANVQEEKKAARRAKSAAAELEAAAAVPAVEALTGGSVGPALPGKAT